LVIDRNEVDSFSEYLASLRATPCLWIGSDQYASTIVYGFYQNFEILISYPTTSDCTLSLEGLA
jgi:hypothetical protein